MSDPNFLCIPVFFSWMEFIRAVAINHGFTVNVSDVMEIWIGETSDMRNVSYEAPSLEDEITRLTNTGMYLARRTIGYLEDLEYDRVTDVLSLIESSGRLPIFAADSVDHDGSVGSTHDSSEQSG